MIIIWIRILNMILMFISFNTLICDTWSSIQLTSFRNLSKKFIVIAQRTRKLIYISYKPKALLFEPNQPIVSNFQSIDPTHVQSFRNWIFKFQSSICLAPALCRFQSTTLDQLLIAPLASAFKLLFATWLRAWLLASTSLFTTPSSNIDLQFRPTNNP